ncbi:sideroflexin-4 isoform X1 [Anolis carolinensis]|uniref:sideroflexin-4 isoform X1 n=1 Tax=Anolis carolinensis TaxID=28377 RepID=UPI002F2B4045
MTSWAGAEPTRLPGQALSGRASPMDLNLEFWRSEGKTFFQRFRHWADILDPLLLLASNEKIDNAKILLLNKGEKITESLEDKKLKEAWQLNLSSVHPGSGDTIPIALRPPAFLPLTAPLVVATSLLHRGNTQTFIWQYLFHSYIGGFTLANGNYSGTEASDDATKKTFPYKQLLVSIGAITYSACMGTLPHYLMLRYKPQSPSIQFLFRNVIPGPLTAILCAFNVTVIRSVEFENGIKIMDSKGKVVGVSQRAGEKAVKETALSRALLFGTAICIPDFMLHFLKRTSTALRNPFVWTPVRSIMMVSVLGAMIPVSFSLVPQVGKIQRNELEPEIISTTEETEFFYNRGV